MQRRYGVLREVETGCDLHHATRIAGCDHVGAGTEDVRDLAISERAGRVRLQQVVDAGRSAADVRLGDLAELELRNRLQHASRLLPDALRMLQMAGVVVRDRDRQRMALGPRLEIREQYRHVDAPG